MPGDEHGTFNLYQAVLLFVERGSRGGKLPVSRDEFIRNLKRYFPGVNYNQLREAIRQLTNQGLLELEMLGPDDFNARLSASGQDLLRKRYGTSAPTAPAPAPKPPVPQPVHSLPPVPRTESAPPAPVAPPQVRKPEPPQPELPEEKVELSTFADVAPEKGGHDAVHGRKDMEDWLNTRLSAINDREETVMAKETEVFEREEALRASESAFLAKADTIERALQTDMERVMEELVRQEHLISDRIASNPSRETGLVEVLQRVKECEMSLEELDKERGPLRKAMRELGGGRPRGAHGGR